MRKFDTMPLLQLPPEILHQIIDHARPEGFEPLMLTCKQIHNSGKSFLAEHNENRRLFRSLAVHVDELASDIGIAMLNELLVEVLYGIARRPELGWFVKELDIRYDHQPSEQAPETVKWLREDRERFESSKARRDSPRPMQQLIQNNPWLKAAGFNVESWSNGAPQLWPLVDNPDQIAYDENDEPETSWFFLLVLLLTRLPQLHTLNSGANLTTLHQGDSEYASLVLNLMSSRIGNKGSFYSNEHTRSIMEPSQRGMIRRSAGLTSPLEGLEEVHCCRQPEYDYRANPGHLDPFLTSPNIRRLYATNLVAVFDGYTGIPYNWPSVDGETSSLLNNRPWGGLEHVELHGCCIDAQGLGNIVSHLPFLKTFRLSFQTKWHGCQHDWSAGEVVQALAKARVPDVSDRADQRSLEGGSKQLGTRPLAPQITDLAINIVNHFGDMITGVSTLLHEFTAVKRLSVDLAIFLGPTIESGERMQDSDDYAGPSTQGATPWKCDESHVPRLIDLIPIGIEELELIYDNVTNQQKCGNWGILLRGFAEEKDQKLPHLKKLIIRGRAAIERARELGMSDYVAEGGPNVAEWQVDFAKREGWTR